MSDAKTYPLQDAVPIAEKFHEFLLPHCFRLCVVGSIRRRKPFVKDIELLIVSKAGSQADPNDLFEHKVDRPAAAIAIDELVKLGVIKKRLSKVGNEAWGPENKLAVHNKSGMPIDFFLVPERNWWNALVVRTGPARSNKAIAGAALKRNWNWHAYGDGFTRGTEKFVVRQERDAFDHVGLPYLPPEKR